MPYKLYVNVNEASDISIEGGDLQEQPGDGIRRGIALWGSPCLAKGTGGTFENNQATYGT